MIRITAKMMAEATVREMIKASDPFFPMPPDPLPSEVADGDGSVEVTTGSK